MTDSLKFTSPMLPGVRFERRSTGMPPVDGTICLVDDGHAAGWERQPVAAKYAAGSWTTPAGRQLPFVPTFWTEIKDAAHA